jgi:two-component system, chemotaxis family, chemotaxis protein CheY
MATVLIADDSVVMQSILQYMVEKSGHKVVALAKHGQEAVSLYAIHRPQLTILDMVMKGADGMSAMLEIKRLNPDARVILVPAEGRALQAQEALEQGAEAVLEKPYGLEKVNEILTRILSG